MIDYGGHDWAAVIGADLEIGDPPVAYCCQNCGRVISGLIVVVSSSPAHEAWLQRFLAQPEHAAAEVQRNPLLDGSAYVVDPRSVDLQPCPAAPPAVVLWTDRGLIDTWGIRLRPTSGELFGRIKLA